MSANESFEQLYARYAERVLRHATRLVGDTAAPDIAQLVWMRVLANLDTFRGEARPSTWLHVITRNIVTDEHRKHVRRGWTQENPIEVARWTPSEAPSPEAQAADRQRRAIAARELRALAPEHQASLLDGFAGRPMAERAARHGIPVPTAKSRSHRARAALQERLHAVVGERHPPQPSAPAAG